MRGYELHRLCFPAEVAAELVGLGRAGQLAVTVEGGSGKDIGSADQSGCEQ